MVGMRGDFGIPLYVTATLVFFVGIAVWVVIGFFRGVAWWFYIFAVVLGVTMAALVVWYLQPKEDKEYWK